MYLIVQRGYGTIASTIDLNLAIRVAKASAYRTGQTLEIRDFASRRRLVLCCGCGRREGEDGRASHRQIRIL